MRPKAVSRISLPEYPGKGSVARSKLSRRVKEEYEESETGP